MNQSIIAIDARALAGQRAGKGRYVLGILNGWREIAPDDQLRIYTAVSFPFKPAKTWTIVSAQTHLAGARFLARDAKATGCAAMLSPTSYSVAAFSRIPTVSVIHDLAVFRCPEARPHWTTWLPERLFLTTALRRSVHLIAVSQFTKKELTSAFGVPSERITVAPNAVDQSFQPRSASDAKLAAVRKRLGLPDSFLLFVGTIEPRKNLLRLLNAFETLPIALQRQSPLVLVGKIGWSAQPIVTKMKSLARQGLLKYLDYLPDSDLPLVYNLAEAAVYPSVYEGFGLPALEALASGTPLLVSNTTSLPELVGRAALLVDPHDVPALAKGLERIITDSALRQQLREYGPTQAQRYTWRKTAQIIRSVLVEILKRGRHG